MSSLRKLSGFAATNRVIEGGLIAVGLSEKIEQAGLIDLGVSAGVAGRGG